MVDSSSLYISSLFLAFPPPSHPPPPLPSGQLKGVSRELNAVFFDYPFTVPAYFALITRALIVLEGIAVHGDPQFDIFAAAYPYALRKALVLFGPSLTLRITKEALFAHK